MLSDSSNSDTSPVKLQRKKPHVWVTSDSDEEEENNVSRKKSMLCRRLSTSSGSSGSCIVRPYHKKKKVISDSGSDSCSSSDSEIDEVFRPWTSKTKRSKSRTLLRSSSESSSEGCNSNSKGTKTRNEVHSSDSDDCEKCIICFKAFRGVIAHPSGCNHNFHSECLLTWSQTSNTCPIDRVKYTEVIVTGSKGEITRHNVVTPPPQDHNNDIEPDDTTFCEVCNQHDREHEMLLCDRCEAGYHLDCLNPPLSEVPVGDWFCPDCTSLRNEIDESEVRDLLRGTILFENRLRERPNGTRPPRVGPRTRAAQRIINSIREMANQNDLFRPSASTSHSFNQPSRRRRKSHRRRRTHYKVELVTTENGSTIEVKVAVNTKRHRKKKRKSCRGRSKVSHSMKSVSSKGSGTADGGYRSRIHDIGVQPLDIFGSRPQLEYFSGCEAEDELDEEGGGLSLLRIRGSGIRNMAGRKQLAARILHTAPRRPVPRVGIATAPPDLLSSILNEQKKWHSPNSIIKSNSNGEIKITLQDQKNNVPVKKSVGSEESSANTNESNAQSSQKEENSRQHSGEASESIPPLQPPPQPVFSRAYDEEDFDLYADIETPMEPPLMPPPEPPALLLALDGEDAASSPEDAMLVIDDNHSYDPDVPTSPPSSPEKSEEKLDVDSPKSTNAMVLDVENIEIPVPRVPSPNNEDDIDDCPNRVMYSEASVNIARETKSDSESDKEVGNISPCVIPKVSIESENNREDLSNVHVDNVNDEESHVNCKNKSEINNGNKPEHSVEEDLLSISESDNYVNIKKEDEPSNKEVIQKCDLDKNKNFEAFAPDNCNSELSNEELQAPKEQLTTTKSVTKKYTESDIEEDTDVKIEKFNQEGDCHKEFIDNSFSHDNIDKVIDDVGNANSEEKYESGGVKHPRELQWSRESSMEKKIDSDKNADQEGEDVLELGCGDDERDGLVDITDEEISTYEKSWELEDNQPPPDKTVGLEGLETEAISDCEYNIAEDGQVPPKINVENGPKEEGEIISEERRLPVAWKKISKSTKERSYREKDVGTFKEKPKKKEKKVKEKRKELERYDVRKIISDKPKKRKVDEFGRDISPSRSRSISNSRSRSPSLRRSRSRSKNRHSRERRNRNRSGRSRGRNRAKSRKRSRGLSKSRSRSGSRRSKSPRKNKKKRNRTKSKEKKRRKRDSSISCSSCSCSSCERERRKSKKLTVIVPNKLLKGEPVKEKRKGKYKDRPDLKRRRVDSPVPSKEVFTSGDNILVSVNFKSSKSGETSGRKEPSKKKKDEDIKKKKDKSSKENQPLRSIVSKNSSVQPSQKKSKINSKNLKPVAIIDLAQSPFRVQTFSPKEVIVLTDSDSDDKRKAEEKSLPPCQVTGPKTPPEPHIKFNIISSKPQMLRSLVNPLLDHSDHLEGDVDEDDDRVEVPHKGPNTPPEPPVPYDPFEPTKSRSPTPLQELEENRIPSPPIEKNLPSLEPPQRSLSPPKPPPESPKTPSPPNSPPPKPPEELVLEKATLSPPNNCNDDSVDMVGGDSPYSPASSETEGLFEVPSAQINTSTPVVKTKPKQLSQKHSQKITPSPLKRKTSNKVSTPLKNSKGSSKKETVGLKLDEDQLKILDDLPNSAVEMQVKDKFLKKLNRQERVVEEVKMVLKPHYAKKHVTKEEYKEILRKSVPKICHSRSGEINPLKIQRLIEAYVRKYRHLKKKRKLPTFSAPESLQPLKPKPKPTMWC